MRTILMVLAGFFAFSSSVYCQVVRYAIPVKDATPVYSNETRKVFEQPLFFVGTIDRLVIKASEKNMMRIETPAQQTGWLESVAVKIVSRNQSISFGEAEIPGYNEHLSPTQIIDGDQVIEQTLNLNRSFAEALRENVDQETITRQSRE
jgi:hypothetical protein